MMDRAETNNMVTEHQKPQKLTKHLNEPQRPKINKYNNNETINKMDLGETLNTK